MYQTKNKTCFGIVLGTSSKSTDIGTKKNNNLVS